MAINFQRVAKSHKSVTPALVQAEVARAVEANKAKQMANARRSQNVAGSVALYNEGMGDKTPINDYLSQALRSGDAPATATPEQVQSMDFATGGEIADPTMDFTMPDTGAAGAEGMNFAMPDSFAGLDPSGAEAGMNLTDGVSGAMPDAIAAGTEGADSLMGDVPVLSAVKGATELANGDVAGAGTTGLQAYLSTLGPYGMAAGVPLGLLR